jgi:probable rRNA maturation factor
MRRWLSEDLTARATMEIEIANRQKNLKINILRLHALLSRVAKQEGFSGNISVALVCDRKMRGLNRRFLKRDYSTDVLSFDLRTKRLLRNRKALREDIDCEVVVNSEMALRVAKSYGHTPFEEVALYCIHGLLHLAGYDDATEEERARMAAKQESLLDRIFTCRRRRQM